MLESAGMCCNIDMSACAVKYPIGQSRFKLTIDSEPRPLQSLSQLEPWNDLGIYYRQPSNAKHVELEYTIPFMQY